MDRLWWIGAAFGVLVAGTAGAEELRRTGICEASAAAILSVGRVAVASDDSDRLAIYNRHGTIPVRSEDLGKVDDIEGAARIGDTVFWITSHSLTGSGKDKQRRRKLLATRPGPEGLPVETGRKFDDLRDVVVAALTDFGPDAVSGDLVPVLDIEGLAATPDGALLLALRMPLTSDGRALIVQIPRPFELLKLDQPPTGSDAVAVFALDLDGRGIRGIERDPDGSYVLIAGPSGDGPEPFDLYVWAGAGRPQRLDVRGELAGMAPEALVIWESGLVEVFGDNGATCQDNEDMPDAERWFPSRVIRY